jgi:type 1 glutamine amidotransferase
MNTPFRFLLGVIGLLMVSQLPVRAADEAAPPAKKKVLFFSKSSGYPHEAVMNKMPDGRPGYAFAVLKKVGEKSNVEFTFSKDGSLFTPEYLAQFDGFMFYTTQDLTQAKTEPRGDGEPPMTAAGKDALLKAIAGGKGFIGLHSAADTFHSPGSVEYGPARFVNDGDKADPYIKMLGGEFISHDAQQAGRLFVTDTFFPGISTVPTDMGFFEEWYSFKNFAPDIHVLMVQKTSRMVGATYERADYPQTWVRMEGKGRVYYTSLGHREDVWNSPTFQTVLVGALNWTLGKVDADVTPNLATVTPKATELPKHYIPPAAAPAKKK